MLQKISAHPNQKKGICEVLTYILCLSNILLRASSLFKFTISTNHAQSLLPTRKPEYRLYNILTANLFYCDYQIQQYRQEIFELNSMDKIMTHIFVNPSEEITLGSDNSSAATQTRYIISADGSEVTDNTTGLIWRRCAEGMTITTNDCSGTATAFSMDQALGWAKKEAQITGKPWRLPSLKELQSIVDSNRCNPAIDTDAFPGTPGSPFWSAPPATDEPAYAWGVNFDYGYVDYGSEHNSAGYRVRLVRSEK